MLPEKSPKWLVHGAKPGDLIEIVTQDAERVFLEWDGKRFLLRADSSITIRFHGRPPQPPSMNA